MKKIAVLLGLFLTTVFANGGRAEWVSFGGAPGTPPEITLKVDSPGLAEIEVRVLGFDLSDTTIDGATYSVVTLPGEPRIRKQGYPALPKVSRSIIIPDADHMVLEVIDSQEEQMTIAPVLPSRGIIMRSEDPDTVSYVFSKLYEKGGMFPDAAAGLGRPYILRDFRGVVCHVHPFSHDPVSGSLTVRTMTTIRIYEDGIGTVNVKTNPRTGRADPSFIAMYDSHFLNYPGQDNRYDLLPETGDILIIAADGYAGNGYLESFMNWKRRRGHAVHFYTCSETDPPTSNGDDLMQVVGDQYLYEIPNLDFVILVGDGAEHVSQYCVPAPWDDIENDNRDDPADNRCAFIEGDDYYPELLISRFPAGNEDELARELWRVEQYERYPSSHGNPWWFTSVTAIASWEREGQEIYLPYNDMADWEWANGILNDFFDYYDVHDPDEFLTEEYYYYGNEPTCPVNPDGIAYRVNSGRSWLTVIGHGNAYCWFFADANSGRDRAVIFSTDDIGLLHNDGMLPFVFSVACDVADWNGSVAPTLAKAWMCAGSIDHPAGSVGFFGSGTELPWTPPLYGQQEAVRVMLGADQGYNPEAHTVGAICFAGISQMIDLFSWVENQDPWYSNKYRRSLQCWLLHGDCSMQIRTLPPEELIVEHPTHVGRYESGEYVSIPVRVNELGQYDQVTATLLWSHGDEQTLMVEMLDATQPEVVFQVPANTVQVIDLTVSGFNKVPYEAQIYVWEDYCGAQAGNQSILGSFRVPNDVIIQAGASLTIEPFEGSARFCFVDDPAPDGREYEICFIVKSNAILDVTDCTFEPISGEWGGLAVEEDAQNCQIVLEGCTVSGAEDGILADGATYAVIEVTACTFEDCCESGLMLQNGQYDVTISGSSFVNCPWGVRIENCAQATDVQIVENSHFEGYDKAVEIVGLGNVDVKRCTFLSKKQGMDLGVVFRDGCSGSVTDMSVFSSWEEADDLLHAIDCRSLNDQITIENSSFNGPLAGPVSTSNRAIYALGEIGNPSNKPMIRSNDISGYSYGVRAVAGSMADLGTGGGSNRGLNSFWDNTCDVFYGGRQLTPPGGSFYAIGNCWDSSTSPEEADAFCGSWAVEIEWDPGFCGAGDGAPPLEPSVPALDILGPNPFSESVQIEVTLPERPREGMLTIEIIDLLGRVVKAFTLADPDQGRYRFQWDSTGPDGKAVPNGVYIFTTKIGGRHLSERIVLLRDRE